MNDDEQTSEVDGPAPLADSQQSLGRGSLIGRYVVLESIGEGGMGVVYSALDPTLDRRVAVKLLRAHGAGSDTQILLLREAQAMARLSHPNVVSIYDVGTFGDRVYLVVELVEGQTLKDWQRQPRPWKEVLAVYRAAGEGLAAAHAADLVHRDFKPANVLLGKDGRVRVMDFGLSRAAPCGTLPQARPAADVSGSVLQVHMTQYGHVMGTPAYMAPELFKGAPADVRSDQFAFAASLYEGLYGAKPFRGDTHSRDDASSWVIETPPDDRQVPDWLRRIVLKELSVSPEARSASFRQLLTALSKDPALRRRKLLGAAAAALGVLALFVGDRYLASRGEALCQNVDARLANIWDATRKAAMQASFLATRKAYAADAWRAVEAFLNTYTRAWVEQSVQACVATRVRGEQSDEVLSLRTACLDSRLQEVRALTDLFVAHADDEVVRRSGAAVNALSELQGCSDIAALHARVKPPASAETRRQVDAIRAKLAEAKAVGDSGKNKQAVALLEPLGQQAHTLGYLPLEAEVLERQAHYQSTVDLHLAVKAAERAAGAALASGDDELAARATQELILISAHLGEFAQGHIWGQVAGAVQHRLGDGPRAAAQLHNRLGVLLWLEAKLDEAALELQAALEIFRRHPQLDPVEEAIAYNCLGNVFAEQGKTEASLPVYQRAYELRREVFGNQHVETAFTLSNISTYYQDTGNYEEALKKTTEVLAVFMDALGEDSINVMGASVNQGDDLEGLGRREEALAVYRWVVLHATKSLGPEHPMTGSALGAMAHCLNMMQRHREGLDASTRALAILTKAYGPKNSETIYALSTLGQAQLGLEQTTQARKTLEDALARAAGEAILNRIRAELQFALARALVAQGVRSDRAATLADEAVLGFTKDHLKARAEEVRTWQRTALGK